MPQSRNGQGVCKLFVNICELEKNEFSPISSPTKFARHSRRLRLAFTSSIHSQASLRLVQPYDSCVSHGGGRKRVAATQNYRGGRGRLAPLSSGMNHHEIVCPSLRGVRRPGANRLRDQESSLTRISALYRAPISPRFWEKGKRGALTHPSMKPLSLCTEANGP